MRTELIESLADVDSVTVIGEAVGRDHEYIDLIVWNTNHFFLLITAFFEDIEPVPWARFQTFRKGILPIRLYEETPPEQEGLALYRPVMKDEKTKL